VLVVAGLVAEPVAVLVVAGLVAEPVVVLVVAGLVAGLVVAGLVAVLVVARVVTATWLVASGVGGRSGSLVFPVVLVVDRSSTTAEAAADRLEPDEGPDVDVDSGGGAWGAGVSANRSSGPRRNAGAAAVRAARSLAASCSWWVVSVLVAASTCRMPLMVR
jgi:hypothetical protein